LLVRYGMIPVESGEPMALLHRVLNAIVIAGAVLWLAIILFAAVADFLPRV